MQNFSGKFFYGIGLSFGRLCGFLFLKNFAVPLFFQKYLNLARWWLE